MVFCAYSALCFSAFPVGWCAHNSYLGLLCCHPYIGYLAKPSLVPQWTPTLQIWKFTVDYFVLPEEKRVHWSLDIVYCCDKNAEKKGKKLVIHDSRVSICGCGSVALCLEWGSLSVWCQRLLTFGSWECVMAEANHLWQLGSWGNGGSQRGEVPFKGTLPVIFLHPAKWYFLVARRTHQWINSWISIS